MPEGWLFIRLAGAQKTGGIRGVYTQTTTHYCCFFLDSKRHSDANVLAVGGAGERLTGLRVAVAGVVVTLTGPTPGAAEVEEPRVALVTLGSVHSALTFAGS